VNEAVVLGAKVDEAAVLLHALLLGRKDWGEDWGGAVSVGVSAL
jgi:hypothetical protein